MQPVVVLFVRSDSVYKTLPGVECYDAERDARTWPGGCPVVAHPPCRTWGGLRRFAKAPPDEHGFAVWAVNQIRKWGGVLEHPRGSKLWGACGLPKPGAGKDRHGGWSLDVEQHWWGHRAKKRTWLYVCGTEPSDAPAWPLDLSEATHVVDGCTAARKRPGARWKPWVSHKEREVTPPAFALWLVELARRCGKHNNSISISDHEDGVYGIS